MKKMLAWIAALALALLAAGAAAEKTEGLPKIPGGSELSADTVELKNGKKYPVYSAPDEAALRGADGKASLAAKGTVQVFGTDPQSGMVLVEYRISKKKCRFGYVSPEAIPEEAAVGTLSFRHADRQVLKDTGVTDDPLCSRTKLASLSEGDRVTELASMGEWAYIESAGGEKFRGFVLAENLGDAPENSADPAGWYQSDAASMQVTANGGSYDITVDVNLNAAGDGNADGYEEWKMNAVPDEAQGRLVYADSERTTYIRQQETEKRSGGAGWFAWNAQERTLSWEGCGDSAHTADVFTDFDPDEGQNDGGEGD